MDTIKLTAFCSVAKLKSYSEAARRLNYTQPAISAQIRELENELNVSLFQKAGKNVELSEAGKAILPFAESLLKHFKELTSILPTGGEKESRTVKIGSSSLPGVHLLPGLLQEAGTVFPNMIFSLGIANNYQVERMLYSRQIEVGFVGRKQPRPGTENLSERFLLRDELVAVFCPNHPLAGREQIGIEELSGLPLILPPRNILTRRQVEERFRHLDLEFNLALEIANTEAIKRMVEHDLGITILCKSAAVKDQAAGWLSIVPVTGLDLSRYFCLLILPSAKRTAACDEFIKFVLDRFPICAPNHMDK